MLILGPPLEIILSAGATPLLYTCLWVVIMMRWQWEKGEAC